MKIRVDLVKLFATGVFILGVTSFAMLTAQEKEGFQGLQGTSEEPASSQEESAAPQAEPASPEAEPAATQEEAATPQGAKETQEVEALKEMIGEIAAIDEARHLLTLEQAEAKGEEGASPTKNLMKFVIDKSTQIFEGSDQLTLSDLEVGKEVKVMYVESWLGRRVARSITVQP